MNTKIILFASIMLFFCLDIMAENTKTFKPQGQVKGKVFWNYSYDLTKGNDKESGFNLRRAYLGYKYQFSESFSADLTFDASHNGDSYNVFVKKAQLDWKCSSLLKLSMGVIGLEHFSDQEKFFSYRYIMKSFNDEYRFGASADLGLKAKVNIADGLSSTLFIINGEGNRNLQDDDGRQKYGASLVYKTIKGFLAKLYYDYASANIKDKEVKISAFSSFVGYNFNEKFKLGAEYNQLFNGERSNNAFEGKDRSGFSFYSSYIFNEKYEIFTRFDIIKSNVLAGQAEAWNYDRDGNSVLFGMQYSPTKGVKIALDYQSYIYSNLSLNNMNKILVNMEFKF